MKWVLVFLAVGSFATVFLGLPHLWGFHPWMEGWLSPVMAGSEPLLAFAAMGAHPVGLEIILQIVGGAMIPIGGGLIAWYFYGGKGQELRDRMALGDDLEAGPVTIKGEWYLPAYKLVYDKYRIDELYNLTVIRPALAMARGAAAFDRWVIDGTVNLVGHTGRIVFESMGAVDRIGVDGTVVGVARALGRAGKGLSELQTSTVRNYFYSVLGGALVIVVLNYVLFGAN